MIDKPAVFVSSAGRTGTQFFADTLARMLPGSVSFHEPGSPWFTKPGKLLRDMMIWGPWTMTAGQASCRRGMYRLSTARFRGEVSDGEAVSILTRLRRSFVNRQQENVYIESSGHLWALLDLLPSVFSSCRTVFVVRDPRTWITSALNTPEYYLYGPFDERLGISIRAIDNASDPYARRWGGMDRFEKYCWFYRAMHDFILPRIEHDPRVRIVRYEDLFDRSRRDELFPSLLEFMAGQGELDTSVSYRPELFGRRIGSNAKRAEDGGFPHWRMWDASRMRFLAEACEGVMRRFGYGGEPEWVGEVGDACQERRERVYLHP